MNVEIKDELVALVIHHWCDTYNVSPTAFVEICIWNEHCKYRRNPDLGKGKPNYLEAQLMDISGNKEDHDEKSTDN